MLYRIPDLKTTAWQKQAETMGEEVAHMKGWFNGMRDNFARLDKLHKSGSGQRVFTERESQTKTGSGSGKHRQPSSTHSFRSDAS